MKEIIIEVDEQGNVQIEGKGFVGGECKKLTKDIEDELGTVVHETLKPEYHQHPSMVQTNKLVR